MDTAWIGGLLALSVAGFECWRWASWRPQKPEAGAADGGPLSPTVRARVSFLVPAWNAEDQVAPFVEQFSRLGLEDRELILCAGGHDRTFEIAKALQGAGVTVLPQQPGEGKQGALQKCWEAATGSYIYLTDIDCSLEDAVIARVLAPLVSGRATVTTGGSVAAARDLSTAFVRCRAAVDQGSLPLRETQWTGLDGRNSALTRAALESAGGFFVDAPSGTDYTLAQELRRRGHTILFIPRAAIRTRYSHRMGAYIRQQRRWLRNVYRLSRKYGVSEDVRRSTATVALGYAAGLTVAAGVFWNHWLLGLAALAAGHVLVSRLGYQKRAGTSVDGPATVLFMAADFLAVLEVGLDLITGGTAW